MNKKIIPITFVIVILIAAGVYMKGDRVIVSEAPQTSTATTTESSVSTAQATSSTSQKEVSVLPSQQTVYKNESTKFSLILPAGWSQVDKANSTTTSNVWFANASSTLVVSRYARTENTERKIEELGSGGFIDVIVNNTVSGFNKYKLVSTKNIIINGVSYRHVVSTYVGTKSQREVTQNLYITLTKDAYYLIGADIYTSRLPLDGEALIRSIGTLKLLP